MIAAARQGGLVGRGPRDLRDLADRLSAIRWKDMLVGFEQAGRRLGTRLDGQQRMETRREETRRIVEGMGGKRRLMNKT